MSVKIRRYKRGGWEVDINTRLLNGRPHRERRKAPVSGRSAAQRWGEERERELVLVLVLVQGLEQVQVMVETEMGMVIMGTVLALEQERGQGQGQGQAQAQAQVLGKAQREKQVLQ